MVNKKLLTAIFSLSVASFGLTTAQADTLHNSSNTNSSNANAAELIKVHDYYRRHDHDYERKRYNKSPSEVRYILRRKGYKRIRFTDKNLPVYKLEACWKGSTYELLVKGNGKIKKKDRIGFCGNKYDEFGHKRKRYNDDYDRRDRDYRPRRRSHYDDDYEYKKSPAQVRRILARRGFNRISFIDRYLPTYKVNACKNGLRYKVAIRYDGSIKNTLKIGYCSTGNRLRDYWRSPRQFR